MNKLATADRRDAGRPLAQERLLYDEYGRI